MILRIRCKPGLASPSEGAWAVTKSAKRRLRSEARRGWGGIGLLLALMAVGSAAVLWLAYKRPWLERLSGVFPAGPVTVLPARIEPFQTTQIHCAISGTVAELLVSPGAEIRRGQTLALLANDAVTEEVRRAQAQFNRAVARLAAARAGGLNETKARLERARFQRAQLDRKFSQQRLESFLLEEDERAWARAKRRLEEVRLLHEQQLLTAAELEELEARVLAEARNLRAAREHWWQLKHLVEAGELELEILKLQLQSQQEEQTELARREYEDARTALWSARRNQMLLTVAAPTDGTVTRVATERGQQVQANSLLFVVVDMRSLRLVAPVSARLARRIRQGTPVTVRLPTEPPRRVSGAVASVVPVPDEFFKSSTVLVTAANPNPETVLVGLEAQVEFPHLGR